MKNHGANGGQSEQQVHIQGMVYVAPRAGSWGGQEGLAVVNGEDFSSRSWLTLYIIFNMLGIIMGQMENYQGFLSRRIMVLR